MNINSKKSLFLIDGSSFLYRAYYGLKPLHNPKGEPVQAVYSFCRMIKKLIETFGIQHIVIVWDSKGKTTRHEMFAQYKATRQAAPSDIFDQKKYIELFAQLVGIKQIAQEGLEADDIMYSIAKEQEDTFEKIIFVTGDKDMTQALNDIIIIFDPMKNEFIHKDMWQTLQEYPIERIPFYYALVGDSSDNIPGVRGVGKKTASTLVKKFESLESLYQQLDQAPTPRIAQLLAQHKDDAFLSYQLFLLQYHKTNLSLSDFTFNAHNWRNAITLFKELNFTSMLKDMGQTVQERIDTVDEKIAFWRKQKFTCVIDSDTLEKMCQEMRNTGYCAIDTETSGLHYASLIGISVCMDPQNAYYIPYAHTSEPHLSSDYITEKLQPLFADHTIKKYMHNAKYDLNVLANHSLVVNGLALDTMIAARLVLPETQKVGLKPLSLFYFNEPMLSFSEIIKSKKYKSFEEVPLDLATLYAAADARQTLKLVHQLEPALIQDNLLTAYTIIEQPLIYVLWRMESKGIFVDVHSLKKLDTDVVVEIESLEKHIYSFLPADTPFINLSSPKQVEQLLFYTLHLPPQKRSIKRTSYSTDQEVLLILADMHPVPGLILKHRELTKLKSTYIDSLPQYINLQTGKVHTSFNQIGTATGRLASSDPNLQNIPSSGYGIAIRDAFKPDNDYLFLAADYSQIELRVLAYLAQEPRLIEAFNRSEDIHTQTAALIFCVPPETVTHEQRQMGKRINFSVLYGLTPYGLSKELKITYKEAKAYIEQYFEQYPLIAQWIEKTISFARKNGYVQTHWNRRRYIPAIYERNRVLYEEACRMAVNAVVQGTTAEIMKKGMILLDNAFKNDCPDTSILLQIHDELLISVHKNNIDQVVFITKKILEGITPDWNVPLSITQRIGHTWHEVTK